MHARKQDTYMQLHGDPAGASMRCMQDKPTVLPMPLPSCLIRRRSAPGRAHREQVERKAVALVEEQAAGRARDDDVPGVH